MGTNMKRLYIACAIFLIIVVVCSSCADNNSDNASSDSEAKSLKRPLTPDPPIPPAECKGNVAPKLLGITLIVNGVETDMPATVLITDTIAIAMKYSDTNCNLDSGKIRITASDEDNELQGLDTLNYHYYPIENIGCSSAETGAPYYVEIDPSDYFLPQGVERNYPWQFRLLDSCNYESQPEYLPLDFTVTEGQ